MADELKVRRAKQEDIESIADLMYRLKKLNEEFDTNFEVSKNAKERILSSLKDSIPDSKGCILLVGTVKEKVVSVIRAELRERKFYEPPVDVRITDFYILPETRRRGLGGIMISKLREEMQKAGLSLLTVEYPAFNVIAKNFYDKLGFKPNITILRYMEREGKN
jgi:ribosomal protein S18 acetylase RimI-like enzyme